MTSGDSDPDPHRAARGREEQRGGDPCRALASRRPPGVGRLLPLHPLRLPRAVEAGVARPKPGRDADRRQGRISLRRWRLLHDHRWDRHPRLVPRAPARCASPRRAKGRLCRAPGAAVDLQETGAGPPTRATWRPRRHRAASGKASPTSARWSRTPSRWARRALSRWLTYFLSGSRVASSISERCYLEERVARWAL